MRKLIADPFDPDMLALHAPHFVAASLDRTHEALERHCHDPHVFDALRPG